MVPPPNIDTLAITKIAERCEFREKFILSTSIHGNSVSRHVYDSRLSTEYTMEFHIPRNPSDDDGNRHAYINIYKLLNPSDAARVPEHKLRTPSYQLEAGAKAWLMKAKGLNPSRHHDDFSKLLERNVTKQKYDDDLKETLVYTINIANNMERQEKQYFYFENQLMFGNFQEQKELDIDPGAHSVGSVIGMLMKQLEKLGMKKMSVYWRTDLNLSLIEKVLEAFQECDFQLNEVLIGVYNIKYKPDAVSKFERLYPYFFQHCQHLGLYFPEYQEMVFGYIKAKPDCVLIQAPATTNIRRLNIDLAYGFAPESAMALTNCEEFELVKSHFTTTMVNDWLRTWKTGTIALKRFTLNITRRHVVSNIIDGLDGEEQGVNTKVYHIKRQDGVVGILKVEDPYDRDNVRIRRLMHLRHPVKVTVKFDTLE